MLAEDESREELKRDAVQRQRPGVGRRKRRKGEEEEEEGGKERGKSKNRRVILWGTRKSMTVMAMTMMTPRCGDGHTQ